MLPCQLSSQIKFNLVHQVDSGKSQATFLIACYACLRCYWNCRGLLFLFSRTESPCPQNFFHLNSAILAIPFQAYQLFFGNTTAAILSRRGFPKISHPDCSRTKPKWVPIQLLNNSYFQMGCVIDWNDWASWKSINKLFFMLSKIEQPFKWSSIKK